MSQSSAVRARTDTSPTTTSASSATSSPSSVKIDEVLSDQRHDPDLLNKLYPGKYGETRWTFGNSGDLAPGRTKESILVSWAWVVMPLFLVAAVLYGMMHIG